MKTYVCYYSCPFCPNPCCTDWEGEANEMVEAENKTEARRFFNGMKQCRYMKITRIVEDKPGFSDASATVNGETKVFKSLGAAINWACDAAMKKHVEE